MKIEQEIKYGIVETEGGSLNVRTGTGTENEIITGLTKIEDIINSTTITETKKEIIIDKII